MKMIFRLPLFHLLLHCATQTLGVKIESVPAFNGERVIQTELEKTVSLVCQPEGGLESEEELMWLRNDAAVTLKEGNTKGSSKVCVTPVIHDDNGATFTCRLRKNATISTSVTLDVTFPPQLSGSEEVTVEEEAVLALSCDIWANPQVSSVSWTLNGSAVDLLASGFTVTNDGSTSQLSTSSVEESLHQGTYQCTASSPKYGEHNKVFRVTVTEKTIKFPLMPIIAGVVVVVLTALLAVASRWKKIAKVNMSSSVMDGVGRAVVGVWRAHTVLDESDGAESSPEAPDRFRKLRSSSSLNSLRMSLRKRLPLRTVQSNSLPENPTWEPRKEQPKPNTVHKLTRSARNSISGVYQRLQRNREFSREECLVETPGREQDTEEAGVSTARTPKRTPGRAATPRRTPRVVATPGRTPGSRGRKTPEASVRGVKTGGGRRQLVRMAALRSPFASPNTQNQRIKFDQDLESVSSGLRRLKHLSKAFDSLIGRDDRSSTGERPGGAVMRKLDPNGKLCRSNLSRRATKLSNALGGWANTAVNTVRKSN
ncbi:hypothetical protein L3Q82_022261 [Xyrichtys novacula]|uniref:Ig-like domain-containing protein n=1 Tax=Xyrichtys novacula TaxID=13765 RepID=A0AAV1FT43_XYRNO|nr:hypothetical protein L3Q82_022261 [Xyrichtys novacula]